MIVGPTRVNTSVGVDHKHATNDFCIAPRLAESGTHSIGRFDHHGRFDVQNFSTQATFV